MGDRCATRSYLRLVSNERPWKGKPSTTQLINGTKLAFLKLTKDFARSPDDSAFMIHGTKGHGNLEAAEDDLSMLEEKFTDDENDTGIADVIEMEFKKTILVDYKTSGSYKVAKALGFSVITEATGEYHYKMVDKDTGEIYKSGPRKGSSKIIKVKRRIRVKAIL